jgi:general secretion pathway protein H
MVNQVALESMLKLVTGMNDDELLKAPAAFKSCLGFTLIEMLVVLVIIGISFGFAVLAFGDFGNSKRILFSAEQLVSTLRMAQQRSLLESSTLGVRIDDHGYQILKWGNNSRWQVIANKGLFKEHAFPEHTLIHLKTNLPSANNDPKIIIDATGAITPFTLSFSTEKEEITTLQGIGNGQIIFRKTKP